MQWAHQQQKGFTIVELLIVIVVIAILAAITIVAYNGITNRAKESSVKSEASQLTKKIEVFKANSGGDSYPATLAEAGASEVSGNRASYSVAARGKGFCLVIKDGAYVYHTTQTSLTPQAGSCGTVRALVGWWPLNGTTNDVSGNNLNGTGIDITSAAGAKGQANTAYAFNGTTSQILCGMSSLLRPTDEVTVTAWVRPTSLPSGPVGIVNNGGGGYWLALNSGNLGLYITNNWFMPTTDPIGVDRWYFVAGTFKAEGTGTSRIWWRRADNTNGYGAMQPSSTVNSISNYSTIEVCQIGSIKSTAGRWFNGAIDDVRIFNKALTSDEIDVLFDAGAY